MPMPYRQLLEMLRPYGFQEVMRFPKEGLELGVIAQRQEILIPYSFQNYIVNLEHGDDSVVDEEIVEAIFRWIENQTGERPRHQ